MRKVVNDRRASLDEETDVLPAVRRLVEAEFERGASIPVVPLREEREAIRDAPGLVLVPLDPGTEWRDGDAIAERIGRWTRERGRSPRLYPASLIWCAKKPGRELREAVELWLAWRRVASEVAEGVLGTEYDRAHRAEVQGEVKAAEAAAKDEVWSGYRFVVLFEPTAPDRLKVNDLGAGHASAAQTLCGRVIAALKGEALLNELVGAGYLDRHWPPAFKDSGAWPLASLRQSFLNGTLTRLVDPDRALKTRIVEFVAKGEFGLASGGDPAAGFRRVWFREDIDPADVGFEAGVYLLTAAVATRLKAPEITPTPGPEPAPSLPTPEPPEGPSGPSEASVSHLPALISVSGSIPPEQWNRLGTRLLPKMRAAGTLTAEVHLEAELDPGRAAALSTELKQIIDELGLSASLRIAGGRAGREDDRGA